MSNYLIWTLPGRGAAYNDVHTLTCRNLQVNDLLTRRPPYWQILIYRFTYGQLFITLILLSILLITYMVQCLIQLAIWYICCFFFLKAFLTLRSRNAALSMVSTPSCFFSSLLIFQGSQPFFTTRLTTPITNHIIITIRIIHSALFMCTIITSIKQKISYIIWNINIQFK